MFWDAVTIALGPSINHGNLEKELKILEKTNLFTTKHTILVQDAFENVGSAGSALNALLVTTEILCHQNGFAVLNEEILLKSKILIVLVGFEEALLVKGHFSTKNGYFDDSQLARAINNATLASENTDFGTFIIGTDSTWYFNEEYSPIRLPQNYISVFSTENFYGPEMIKNHGFYKVEEDIVTDIFYGIKNDSNFICLAFLYLPSEISCSFLRLYSIHPISHSTYFGKDSGTSGLKISLFFDIILSSCFPLDIFMKQRLGGDKIEGNSLDLELSRKVIHQNFCDVQSKIVIIPCQQYKYRQFNEKLKENQFPPQKWQIFAHLHFKSIILHENPVDLGFIREMFKKCEKKNLVNYLYQFSKILCIIADGKGGLRNGPANNQKFLEIFEGFQSGEDYSLQLIDEIERNWLSEPFLLVRAARHVEAAAQIIISRKVKEICEKQICPIPKRRNSFSTVLVRAPVRMDIFGGWLDTPPITFDVTNSAVYNMAILVDGQYPISCSVKKIDIPGITVSDSEGESLHFSSTFSIFEAHNAPLQRASLVCACIVATGLLQRGNLLENVLKSHFESPGLEIVTKSDLPHGSGLGTSSILASCILKAIFKLIDDIDDNSLIHMVLLVEQLLTTGGGWQDQVGAIIGGLKMGYFDQKGQSIKVKRLAKPRFLNFGLVYTGKTRLAKNLLQSMIRNFYEGKVKNIEEMQKKMSSVFNPGLDYDAIELYSEAKKELAEGCVPPKVKKLIELLKKNGLIKHALMAGAGGGGFLYLFLDNNVNMDQIWEFLKKFPEFSEMSCHTATFCEHGLLCEVL